jgi:hypothetical protein
MVTHVTATSNAAGECSVHGILRVFDPLS